METVDSRAEQEETQPKENYIQDTYTITAYCACEKCCGKWATNRPLDENGQPIVIGAANVPLTSGYSVASPLPMGTIVEFDDKQYEVQDRTAQFVVERYNGKIIDVYFDSHEKAVEFAKQEKEVKIYENTEKRQKCN